MHCSLSLDILHMYFMWVYIYIYMYTSFYIYVYYESHFMGVCMGVHLALDQHRFELKKSTFFFNKYIFSQFILECGTCRYGGPLWDLRILGFCYPQRWILEPVSLWILKNDYVTWSERNWLYYYLLLVSLDAHISYNRMWYISLLTS